LYGEKLHSYGVTVKTGGTQPPYSAAYVMALINIDINMVIYNAGFQIFAFCSFLHLDSADQPFKT